MGPKASRDNPAPLQLEQEQVSHVTWSLQTWRLVLTACLGTAAWQNGCMGSLREAQRRTDVSISSPRKKGFTSWGHGGKLEKGRSTGGHLDSTFWWEKVDQDAGPHRGEKTQKRCWCLHPQRRGTERERWKVLTGRPLAKKVWKQMLIFYFCIYESSRLFLLE